ncbi:aspartate ammonia-lyase [Bacillus sp. JJ722]|uniref:aspartate ammonia-lyase n=1 Tax=Bacillus sp. JJ722 TaxID=3122973 RepID=UPI003F68AAA9
MRIEKDFLGTLEIPTDVYYGIQTVRAKENFPITGQRCDEYLICALAIVKKAAAYANFQTNQLDEKIATSIMQAADEIVAGKWFDQFIVDPIQGGAGTSLNMNMNEVIANRTLELLGYNKGDYQKISPNSHVNMSQSTNDAFPTAIHIATITLLDQLLTVMEGMIDTFKEKSKQFDKVIKMGRTHLQDAVPIRLGQEFAAYAKVIERDYNRISQAKEHLYEINIGATAIGTCLNANAEYIEIVTEAIARFTKQPFIQCDNYIDGTQNTDFYTEVSSTLKITMLNLSKICNDLRLMASGPKAGLAEILLPERQPGSSIMPGKVNPVMLEVINQIAFQVVGNDTTICMASEAGQFELNVMEPVLVHNLLQSIRIMTNGFEAFTEYCLKDIKANEELMKQYVDRSIGIVTAIAPYVGYEMASKIAREALTTNMTVRELCLKYEVLTEEQINTILNPYRMTSLS